MADEPGAAEILVSKMQELARDAGHDEKARAELLQISRELTASLEAPDEAVSLVSTSGGRNMVVRVSIDLKLFDSLSERSPQDAQELADLTDAEEGLVIRFLRTLAGMGFVEQIGQTRYAANPITRQMAKASVKAGVKFKYDQGYEILVSAPEYFKANGYRLPRSMTDGPFQFAHKTDEGCYEFWAKQPGVMENFNVFMQGLYGTPTRLGWTDWFPVDAVCLQDFDATKSEYSWVDVGAGKGHETELVIKKWPEARGKFVVEDLPFVINDIENLDDRIARLPHDFTKPQPIKGARTYFLQNILHNWASPVCHSILTHLKDAMIPGYSKIIIGNIILPEENVPLRNSSLDIAMLYLHSGGQRSAFEWRRLVEEAGLRVVKVWHPPGDGDGIVEAELPA